MRGGERETERDAEESYPDELIREIGQPPEETGAPQESSEQKERHGARERPDMQGEDKRQLTHAESPDLREAAARVDDVRLGDMPLELGGARPRHPVNQRRADHVQEQASAREGEKASRRKGEHGQHEESGQRVFGEDVAIPDEE